MFHFRKIFYSILPNSAERARRFHRKQLWSTYSPLGVQSLAPNRSTGKTLLAAISILFIIIVMSYVDEPPQKACSDRFLIDRTFEKCLIGSEKH